MRRFITIKPLRFLLSVTVSVWMAGAGCLFGCTEAMAAENSSTTPITSVVAHKNCHEAKTHDCCAKNKSSNIQSSVTVSLTPLVSLSLLVSENMSDCPMAANQTATISKEDSPTTPTLQARSTVRFETTSSSTPALVAPPRQVNRGPTHTLYCVFLI